MDAQQDREPLRWARSWWPTIAVVLLFAVARMVYMAFFSPYTLIEDEAHYWDWSRHIDWSYYSKGPGVAWVIWLGTALFGDTELGVRTPAVVASVIGALAVAALARATFRDGRVGFLGAVALMSMPGHHAVSMLMTIDGPYLACWALAALSGWLAVTRETGRAPFWAGLGLAIGVGFLFKYTIAIFPVGFVLYLLITRKKRPRARARELALATACALAGLLPVIIWNGANDWVTVRHLLGHLGLPGGDTIQAQSGTSEPYDPMWTLEFIGLQFAVAGPMVVVAILGLINLARAGKGSAGDRDRSPAWAGTAPAYLVCLALPMFALYALVTIATNVEANWTIAGFVTLAPIAGWAALDAYQRRDNPVKFAWHATLVCLMGFVVAIPLAGWLGTAFGRGVVPGLSRSFGARTLASQVEDLAVEMRAETGEEPVYTAIHYGRASLLAFYLPGQPRVYAAQSLFGGRKTQYDLWPETDLRNVQTRAALVGRPGVLMGGEVAIWSELFEGVTEIGRLPAEPKRDRRAFTALRFTGDLPDPPEPIGPIGPETP